MQAITGAAVAAGLIAYVAFELGDYIGAFIVGFL
jgi:hypothetical protein